MTDYKPDTVAIATVHGDEDVRVFRGDSNCWITAEGHGGNVRHFDFNGGVTDVRPLMVLDWHPNQSDLPTLLMLLRDNYWTSLADQIEEQAKPARIEEPQGYGALVRTDYPNPGSRWIKGDKGWTNLDANGGFLNWSEWKDIHGDPELIREGVDA